MNLDLPMIGMKRELGRIRDALRNGQSLLVLGAPGAGKTKLLQAAIGREARGILYLAYAPVLHDLLIRMGEALMETRHGAFSRMLKGVADPCRWLPAQTSVHLKGLLWTALETEPLTIVLDGVDGASARTYRFLQRLYHTRGVSLIATARDIRSLDRLGRLFWDPRAMLQVEPLDRSEAAFLFEMLVKRLGLEHLDIGDFRARALEAARGNPGQIVDMCKLAADPKYWSGRHIKFAPLRIDAYARLLV